MNKFLYILFGGLACFSIALSGGVIARDMSSVKTDTNQQEQSLVDNSPANYEIDGSTLITYVGNARNVVVPSTYSIDGVKPVEICKDYEVNLADYDSNLTIDFSDYSSLPEYLQRYGYEQVQYLVQAKNSKGLISDGLSEELEHYIGYCSSIACGYTPSESEQENMNKLAEKYHLTSSYDNGIQTFSFYYDTPNYIPGTEHKITKVSRQCFQKKNTIESITFSEGITDIDYWCIDRCENLKSVSFPKSFSTFDPGYGYGPIDYCYKLERISVDKENECFTSGENDLYILDKTTNKLLTSLTTEIPTQATAITNQVFSCLTGELSITIPDTISNLSINLVGEGSHSVTYFDCSAEVSFSNSYQYLTNFYWGDIKAGKKLTVVLRSDTVCTSSIKNTEGNYLMNWVNVLVRTSEGETTEDYKANIDKYNYVEIYVPDELLSTYQTRFPKETFKAISELEE